MIPNAVPKANKMVPRPHATWEMAWRPGTRGRDCQLVGILSMVCLETHSPGRWFKVKRELGDKERKGKVKKEGRGEYVDTAVATYA